MISSHKAVCFLAVLLIPCAPLALAQGTYTQIDYPGAAITQALGIDAAGDITGAYANSGGSYQGFILRNGTFTTIDQPGFQETVLTGINNKGQQVAGASLNAAGNLVGFTYDLQTRIFSQVIYPDALNTSPFAINDSGIVAGRFDNGGASSGFVLVGSAYTTVLPPSATWTQLYGVTDRGVVVGIGQSQTLGTFNFVYAGGKYRRRTMPNTGGAGVTGVSPGGTILVGYYAPSSGIQAAFVYQGQTLTELQPFGSSDSFATGVNNSLEAVGTFLDADNNTHGFLWTPPADAARK